MRSVPEWEGDNDDQKVPPRVRLRIFERFGGRCYLSGQVIRPGDRWELDHIRALSLGGRHCESNLAPILRDKHKVKTAQDRRVKAKTDRIRNKFIGNRPKSRWQGSRDSAWKKKVDGTVVRRRRG